MSVFKGWSVLDLENRAHLPEQPGLYAVLDNNGHAWYVGKSVNLNARWAGGGHHRYGQAMAEITSPRLAFTTMAEHEIHGVETDLIRYCKSIEQANWNNTPVPGKKPVTVSSKGINWLGWGLAAFAAWFASLLLNNTTPQPASQQQLTPLYTAPSLTSPHAAMVPDDATVEVLECTPAKDWAKVRWTGVEGWSPMHEFSVEQQTWMCEK